MSAFTVETAAAEGVAPYLDSANDGAITNILKWEAAPNVSNYAWEVDALAEARAVAGTAPAVVGVQSALKAAPLLGIASTATAGAGAFAFGWQIGSAYYNRFLKGHIEGDSRAVMASTTSLHPSDTPWNLCQAGACPGVATTTTLRDAGFALSPDGFYVFEISWNSSSATEFWVSGGGISPGNVTFGQAATDIMQNQGFGHVLEFQVATQTHRALIATPAEMAAAIHVESDDPYTGSQDQLDDLTGQQTFSAPTTPDLATFRDFIGSSTQAIQDLWNHALDPDNYAEPGPNGETAEPYTIPSCDGLTASACIAAINAAADGAFVPQPTVTQTTLGIDGAVVTKPAGAVVSMNPEGGSIIQPGVASTTTIELEINPDPLPIELPQPGANETYTDYVARLQALGLLGTITQSTIGDPEITAGPDAPVRIEIPDPANPTLTKIYTPAQWPIPLPRALPNAPIKIYTNPTDAPPAESEYPAPTPIPSPDTTCGPNIPPPDFSAFTTVNPGDKFPFGIFTYVLDTLEPIVATPTAPVFDIPIKIPAVNLDSSIHLDLTVLNPYMATIRLLMSIGIGLTAVWLLGSSLLGFKAGNAGGGLTMDTEMDDM